MEFAAAPAYTGQILKTLEDAGHRAYLVGGCVRDMLLGRRPMDWDICTDAEPDRVLALFPGAVPTGLRHGTVTVRLGRGQAEVTTFRADGDYSDHRRPDSVRFVRSLTEDLRRRDFTINAMALSCGGVLTDIFGGRQDIEGRVVRCVGDPAARFGEDALRMLRALRFCAQLGFALDPATDAAIRMLVPTAALLAPERVRDELEKMLLSPRPVFFGQALESGLLRAYLSAPAKPFAPRVLRTLPRDRRLRWAALCALLRRDGLLPDPAAFLAALRLDNAAVRCCADGAALADRALDRLERKRLLADRGPDTALCYAAAREALGERGALRAMRGLIDGDECWSLRTLAVDGGDLLALGLRGAAVGQALHALLSHVLAYPGDNERAVLLDLARRWLGDIDSAAPNLA